MKLVYSILFIILSLIPAVAIADGDPARDPFYSKGVELSEGPSVNAPVERVDPFSGNLSIVQTDIELPGNGGLDLKLMRFYDSAIWSRRDTSFSGVTAWNERSPMGIGWSMHMGIVRNPFGRGSNNRFLPDNPVFELPDGSRKTFYQDKNNSNRLISTDFWVYERNSSGAATTWTIKSPEGFIYSAHFGNNAGYYTNDSVAIAQVVKIENPSKTASINITYKKSNVSPWVSHSYLDKIVDSVGRTVSFNYSFSKHQLKSVSVNGLSYEYTYKSVGTTYVYNFLTRAQPNVGSPWEYTYDTNYGYQLTTMEYPGGGKVNYTYDDIKFDTGKTDVKFRVVKKRETSDPKTGTSGSWSYSYNSSSSSGAVTTVRAPNGVTEAHTFYGWGNSGRGDVWRVGLPIKTVVSQSGLSEQTTYSWSKGTVISNDQLGNANWSGTGGQVYDTSVAVPFMTQKSSNRNGATYTTSYSSFDTYGNAKKIVESGHEDRTHNLIYWTSSSKNIVQGKIDQETITGSYLGSYVIDNKFLSDGRLDYVTRYGVKTDYDYDNKGNIDTIKDARGNMTYLTWTNGQVSKIQNPIYTINRGININGTIASETNGRGNRTSYSYDGNLRPTKITPPMSNSTSVSYVSDNSVRTVTRGGFWTKDIYDGFGRLIGTRDSSGVSTNIGYAAYGYKTYENSNIGDRTDYDMWGRPIKVTHLDNTYLSYSYSDSSAGLTVTQTDEMSKRTSLVYAAFGDPDEKWLVKVTDALGNATSYDYNILGSLTRVTQPGSVSRTYTYNSSTNFLLTETHPETGKVTYTRDAIGNLLTRTDAESKRFTYTYDKLNRLTRIQSSGGDVISYGYDNADNRISVESPSADITIGYDAVNRPVSKNETIASKSYSMAFSYDGNDNLQYVTYPSGRKIQYTYNSNNQVATIPGYINSTISYTLAGQPKKFTYSNGIVNQYDYSARFQVEGVQAGSFLNLGYWYDDRGNLESINGIYDQDFTYDALSRLTGFDGAWGSGTFTYDNLGNRKTKKIGSKSSTYSYNGNYRLTKITGSEPASYSYDSTGKVKQGIWLDGSFSFSYDDHNNLLSVSTNNGDDASYGYDADNQRVLKTVAGETTIYHYGLHGQVLAETSEAGVTKTEYVYLGDKLITKIDQEN